MANYETNYCAVIPLREEHHQRACEIFGGCLDQFAGGIDFNINEKGQAVLHDDDACGNYDDAIFFVQQLVKEIGPTLLHEGLTRWGFQWSNTCDRHRVDAFGGGAWMIDVTTGAQRIMSTVTWLEDEENAETFIANMEHTGSGV